MNVRPGTCAFAFLLLLSAACGGPSTPSPIEGEPVCPDFEIGATRAAMRGSLRYPVTVTVLDDGDPVTRATLYGRRTKDAPASRILLPDEDAEYDVEWGQCENQRAPRAVSQKTFESKDAAEYACGNAAVYKTEKIVTKKGDPASRKLHFPAPPKQECWESEVPKTEAPPAADAGAEPPQADAAAADAAVEDAGAAADAGLSGATPAPDAGKAAPDTAKAAPVDAPKPAPAASPDAAKPAASPDATKPAPTAPAGATKPAPATSPDAAKPALAAPAGATRPAPAPAAPAGATKPAPAAAPDAAKPAPAAPADAGGP